MTYERALGTSELNYVVGLKSHYIFTVDGFYWTNRSHNEYNIIKIKPMKKYQKLEQQVKDLQKEIDRLKKEEQQQNKLPGSFNLGSA